MAAFAPRLLGLAILASLHLIYALPNKKCEPQERWDEGCQQCRCGEAGEPLCEPHLSCQQDHAIPPRYGPQCRAGTSWEDDCYECECSALSRAICRQKNCNIKTKRLMPTCRPRTSWPDDCNTCSCLENGQVACTLLDCHPDVGLGARDKRETERGCFAGSKWRSEAESCKCDSFGRAICTPIRNDITTDSPPTTSGVAMPTDSKVCAPGTSWKSFCNTCECTETGRPKCETKNCQEVQCLEGSTWKDACNDCRCTQGQPICTRRACGNSGNPVLFWNPDAASRLKETGEKDAALQLVSVSRRALICTPGELKAVECNTCTCNDKGSAFDVCTKRECLDRSHDDIAEIQESNHRLKRDVCDPGRRFLKDCNECVCDPFGTSYGCTTFDCLSDDVEVFMKSEDPEMGVGQQTCKPNEEFKRECNTCQCDARGLSFTCTTIDCLADVVEVFADGEVISGGYSRIKRNVCKPNDKFMKECNECVCDDTGESYQCSDFNCMNGDVEVFMKNENTSSEQTGNKSLVCEPNRSFVKGCNTCWCNDDGTGYSCTRKVCVPDLPEEVEVENEEHSTLIRQCRPDEVFEVECNMCRCNADGKSYSCTKRACVTDAPNDVVQFEEEVTTNSQNAEKSKASRKRSKRETTEAPLKTCVPDKEFRLDCNNCLCHTDGLAFSCTRYDCAQSTPSPPSPPTQRRKREVVQKETGSCVPGSVFEQECNVCRCAEDGRHATCTVKRCPPPASQRPADASADNKTENAESAGTTSDFRCTPGEQFKRSCNDCTCSADGRSVFCTLRLCDDDISHNI